MRKTISGMVAAVAVMMTMGAAPAMACYAPCVAAPVYVSPAPVYSGCNSGCGYGGYGGYAGYGVGYGGWATERLPDPVHQYYYVNQGPTYSGPGNWAPRPVYQESSVSYGNPHYGYRTHRHYGHRYSVRPSVRYGYAPRVGYGPRLGYGPRHGYMPRHSMRHHGHHQHRHHGHVLRRYN